MSRLIDMMEYVMVEVYPEEARDIIKDRPTYENLERITDRMVAWLRIQEFEDIDEVMDFYNDYFKSSDEDYDTWGEEDLRNDPYKVVVHEYRKWTCVEYNKKLDGYRG